MAVSVPSRRAPSRTVISALGALPVQNFAWTGKADEANKLLLPWPATASLKDSLQLTHDGRGQPWVAWQALAAVPVTEARANGLRVAREVTALQQKQPGKASRGDLWRVRLTIASDQEMSWVVVSDPIPGGARILGDAGSGARDARLAVGFDPADNNKAARNVWPTYVERSFANYRAYYGYVPRGTFTTEYTLRLNNAGEFSLPATRVEAMYAPEIFGETPNAKVLVGE